jgi:hypothetical protein
MDANLRGANKNKKLEEIFISYTSICPEGTITGWKKCKNDIIVKLEIPAEAKRSNATGRKCRAEYAKVIEIIGDDIAISQHDVYTCIPHLMKSQPNRFYAILTEMYHCSYSPFLSASKPFLLYMRNTSVL